MQADQFLIITPDDGLQPGHVSSYLTVLREYKVNQIADIFYDNYVSYGMKQKLRKEKHNLIVMICTSFMD